jgi:hypothetical protein
MDATAVHEAAAANLAGTMSFPQVVAKLMGAVAGGLLVAKGDISVCGLGRAWH